MPAVLSTTATSAASHENAESGTAAGDSLRVPGADALVAPAEFSPLAWVPALEAMKPVEQEHQPASVYEFLATHDYDQG